MVTSYGTDSIPKLDITPKNTTEDVNTRFRLTAEIDSGIDYDTIYWYTSDPTILKLHNTSTIYAPFDALKVGSAVVYCILFKNGTNVIADSNVVTIQ